MQSGPTALFILRVLKISTTSDSKMVICDKVEFVRFWKAGSLILVSSIVANFTKDNNLSKMKVGGSLHKTNAACSKCK